ncbi:MAG: choline dehydrogenase [Betaproteobacteria bacterium]|nr:choline dehydrogenase [Betaproteobacteria bacterium]MBI2960666.1 choline dehydrogenase [Betaproteobacteria bacterium]
MTTERVFDYVIVGAGSAGCTLANRLTEDTSVRVLVLEAGLWDRDLWIRVPIGWGKILQRRLHDWKYFSEPEPALNGRRIECARGKVIGGCSSINAMMYTRGHRLDYDRWARAGLSGWSFAHALPYFRKQESWEGGADAYRGGNGPLATRMSSFDDPLVEAYFEAGKSLGYAFTNDYNGAQTEGFARLQSTIRDGKRCSAADAYLRPALARANLSVEVGVLATRIAFEGTRAVGIEYAQGAQTAVARAEREVILSGGVINSPQLLMLSGIGDPDELRALGIEARVPLKGVGKNLQDHLSVGVDYARKGSGRFREDMRLDRVGMDLLKARLLGAGSAIELPSGWTAFLKTQAGTAIPDIQLLFRATPPVAGPYLPPFKRAYDDGFCCRAVLIHPQSRGEIKLASANPRDPVRIRQNFLAADRDKRTLRAGVRLVRELARQAPLAKFVAAEIAPGKSKSSGADVDAHIRAVAATAHHPLGTCKMGVDADAMAVVDSELRVRGTQGLRVVDASVMPDLVGGNINAPVIMIAERAADLIRGRAPLAPAAV